MTNDSELQSGAAVSSSEIVRPRRKHPWQTMMDNAAKLKAARKERKRIRERGELHKEWQREHQRKKRGIDPALPIMKPWDHAKGRVV